VKNEIVLRNVGAFVREKDWLDDYDDNNNNNNDENEYRCKDIVKLEELHFKS
jgi:hypothetical protein